MEKRLVFRYYDPRVLRIYLPTCLASEFADGCTAPIERFWTESESPEDMLEFCFREGGLEQRTFSLGRRGNLMDISVIAVVRLRPRKVTDIRHHQP